MCAVRPHVSYAPTEPAVRARLRAETPAGEAWRCLRCGTFVPGPPAASGPAAGAPRVRRDDELRSALILRAFAVERFLRGVAVRLHRLRHLAVQVFAAVRRAHVRPGVPRGQVAAARARLQHRPVRPGRPDPAHVHPGPAHADLARDRRGRLHGGGVPGSDRAVAAAPLGRVLRLRGHLGGHPVRDLRAGRQGHRAPADRVPGQRGAGGLPGAVQAAARRARRQGGLRGAAAQRIDHAGGDRRGRRRRRPAGRPPTPCRPASGDGRARPRPPAPRIRPPAAGPAALGAAGRSAQTRRRPRPRRAGRPGGSPPPR